MPELGVYFALSITMLAMINPVGALPAFLSMTASLDAPMKRKMALVAGMTAASVLLLAAWLGGSLLSVFGVSLPAFQTGGGIVVLLIALSMVQASTSPLKMTAEEQAEAARHSGLHAAVIPIGLPLLTGPGVIATSILFVSEHSSAFTYSYLTASGLLTGMVCWWVLLLAEPIGRALGSTGMNIVTRLSGLILAGIGVENIAKGLLRLFPGLG